MKKLVLYLLAIPIFGAAQDLSRHLDPRIASENREPARTGEVRREDQWVQELTEWTQTQTTDGEAFTANFRVPFEWLDRCQFLRLEGVSGAFEVWVNDRLAGYSASGAEPSEFDVTPFRKEGLNDLRVVVFRDYAAQKLEDGRAAMEPQLVGNVSVISQPLLRVRDISVASRFENAVGLMELGVVMRSHRLNALTYNVAYELLSPDGEVVAWEDKDFSVDMRRDDTVRFFARVRDAKEWTTGSPTLYKLVVKTTQNGRTRERVSYRVAFQSDERPELVMHDFAASGTLDELTEAIEALKKDGVNTLVLKELPASNEFYDLCDRLGIYVCPTADLDTHKSGDSRKVGGNPSNDPTWGASYSERVLWMYHRVKTHPSVALFRLASDGSGNGINLYDNYLMLKELEHSRPVIYRTDEWNTDPLP